MEASYVVLIKKRFALSWFLIMLKKAIINIILKGDFNRSYNSGQKSSGQYCNIHIFLSFLGSLLKQCILFEIFWPFSLSPPYTKLKLRKNSGYTRPTLFVRWGEELDLCELKNAPETQKCPETFFLDCRWGLYHGGLIIGARGGL